MRKIFPDLVVIRNITVPKARGWRAKKIDTKELQIEELKKLLKEFPGAKISAHVHLKRSKSPGTRISTKIIDNGKIGVNAYPYPLN